MLDHIEKLLLLQERDRQIAQLEAELADIGPHRRFALQTLESAKNELESLKSRVKKLETERNKLELEVKEKKQLIEKYSLQQFQTKKNPEYQALAHEIENCKRDISNIEDRELEVLEQIDATQKQVATATETLKQISQRVEQQLATFAQRETSLRQRLAELARGRAELAASVDADLLPRYERLRKSKGQRAIVGIEHSVCGGCHVKLPAQVVVGCKANQEIMICPNCGRILYYTHDMNTAAAE